MTDDAGVALALGEAGPLRGTLRFSHAAMATLFEVHCAHADGGYARQAAQAAFDVVDRLERDMSRFIANSDVSRINHLAAGESTRVSPGTMQCLEIAWHLHALTGGVFDVTIGSGIGRLELVPDDFAVRARDGGARLDLGGIGKGYAVDRMAEVLEEWEVPRALVHGGFSSVLALEAPPDRDGWPLTLSAPADGRVLARVSVRRRALSASGVRKGDHILDPRSGRPVRDRAAWASIPGRLEAGESPAAVAEGLSTAFMILSAEEVADLCRRSPGLEAWLLREPAAGSPALLHLGAPGT